MSVLTGDSDRNNCVCFKYLVAIHREGRSVFAPAVSPLSAFLFFTFNLDTATDGFWHRLCTDWIFLPLSFSIYESLSRQTHFLTLETKCCDKAISPGFWRKIPARRTWQGALRPKSSANKIDAGHRWTNLCPGDVTSESLTIRDIQALEGVQEEQSCESSSHPDNSTLPFSTAFHFLFCHPGCQPTTAAESHPYTRWVAWANGTKLKMSLRSRLF